MIEKKDIKKLLTSRYNTASSEDERNLLIELMDGLDDLNEIQSIEDILNGCIGLMRSLNSRFNGWMDLMGIEADEEIRFCTGFSYYQIIKRLFFENTNYIMRKSVIALCKELGVEHSEEIEFRDTRYDTDER